MLAGLDQHLLGCGRTYSIVKDKELKESRLVLNRKVIQLKETRRAESRFRLWDTHPMLDVSACPYIELFVIYLSPITKANLQLVKSFKLQSNALRREAQRIL